MNINLKKLDRCFLILYYEYLDEIISEFFPVYDDATGNITGYARYQNDYQLVIYSTEEYLELYKDYDFLALYLF